MFEPFLSLHKHPINFTVQLQKQRICIRAFHCLQSLPLVFHQHHHIISRVQAQSTHPEPALLIGDCVHCVLAISQNDKLATSLSFSLQRGTNLSAGAHKFSVLFGHQISNYRPKAVVSVHACYFVLARL
jgi:hypothetical protein